MDPYPIGSPFSKCGIGLAADWAQQAMREMYRSRGMWQVPQAFDWVTYVKETYAGKDKNWKKPPLLMVRAHFRFSLKLLYL